MALLPALVAYPVLKALSHARHRMSESAIVREAESYEYEPELPRWFLSLLDSRIAWADRRVLDIGSGYGDLAIFLAQHGVGQAVGVEVDAKRVAASRRNAARYGVADRTDFVHADFVGAYVPAEAFDIIFSLDAFEHILDPIGCLQKAYACLRPGGRLATLFGPLWLSPYGAHMQGFTPMPWVHLIFPEKTVLRVRAENYRPDDAVERYEDVVGHLSRMTVSRFRRCIGATGFQLRYFRLNPDKDRTRGGALRPLNALINHLPGVCELGAQLLLAVLAKPE